MSTGHVHWCCCCCLLAICLTIRNSFSLLVVVVVETAVVTTKRALGHNRQFFTSHMMPDALVTKEETASLVKQPGAEKKSNRAWVICIQRELWQALLCTPQTITNNLWYTSEKVVILHMMESFFAHVLSKKVLKNKAWTILTIFWQMSETSPSVCRLLKCYSTDLRVSNSFARVHE